MNKDRLLQILETLEMYHGWYVDQCMTSRLEEHEMLQEWKQIKEELITLWLNHYGHSLHYAEIVSLVSLARMDTAGTVATS